MECSLYLSAHISYPLNLLFATHFHITIVHLMCVHKFSASINVARAAGVGEGGVKGIEKQPHLHTNILIYILM